MLGLLKHNRIRGILLTLVSIAGMFGLTIDPDLVDQLLGNVETIIALATATIGIIVNLYGSITAKGPLGMNGGEK